MAEKIRVAYYLNQFFGQIGGEDKAGIEPQVVEGGVGVSSAFERLLKDKVEVIGTVICGDNYFNEKYRTSNGKNYSYAKKFGC